MLQSIFSIAIDGPAGAGKSSIAKTVSQRLNAIYLDTGAMYRTMALYMNQNNIQSNDAIAAAVNDVNIKVEFINGQQYMILDGTDVTGAIRSAEISMMASRVASVPEVRERLVALQREIAENHSVVMDGRDIGTKVLPNATLKIFLTASCEVRAERRFKEMREKNPEITYESVLEDIIKRDYNDSHREASPMVQAEDAVRVDTSDMTPEQVVARIIELLNSKGGDKA